MHRAAALVGRKRYGVEQGAILSPYHCAAPSYQFIPRARSLFPHRGPDTSDAQGLSGLWMMIVPPETQLK
jgi:hypothetical protein